MRSKIVRLAICVVALVSAFTARSQYYYYNDSYYDKDVIWEVGTSAGLMIGITDIGSKKGFMPNLKNSQVNGSLYVGALYQNLVGLRLELTWGRVAGADSNGAFKTRNLSFRTPIMELAAVGELHFLNFKYRDEPLLISPYFALGLGLFDFNPQAKLGETWVDLQPLRTEGQGFPETASLQPGTEPYNLRQSCAIVGLGLKYDLSPLITIRGEVLYRKTYTDYLDDASTFYIDPTWFDNNLSPARATLAKQLYDRSAEKDPTVVNGIGSRIRGSSKTKDGYLTVNIKIAVSLGRQKKNW
jgi:hypothetical protein